MYYVYVLRSIKDNNFYIGYTSNLKERVRQHSEGISKSTVSRRPMELVYYEASRDIKDAMHREKYLKTTYGHRYLRNRLKNDFSAE